MLTQDIAKALGARLDGDGTLEIKRLVHPAQAEGPADLALATNAAVAAALNGTAAQAIVVAEKNKAPAGTFRAIISVDEPRRALATLTSLFDRGPVHSKGVHPTAIVAPDAAIGEDADIGAYVVIGAGSRIGANTVILPHVTIGAGVAIGAQCLFHAGVRIGDGVFIGDRVIVHANAVIGSDGFSFAPDLTSPDGFRPGVKVTRIHSLGTVEIGDDVEIGAASTIDRSTLEATRIGRGTKIDNHVHIGHNVTIGESCVICGMVGIAGSVTLGDRVRIGGGVGIGDHITIGTAAVVAAGSGVGNNIPAGSFVSGYPALPHGRTIENLQYLGRQKRLHGKVDEMRARLDALERTGKGEESN
jgi:UDP-3-O-[3-hydroxymyristoyl] glucosamine N-acyltransferase